MWTIQPSPAGSGAAASPLPVIVVDNVRDAIDWLVLALTVLSGIASVVAIVIAVSANRIAREVDRESVIRATREHRRNFELDILKSLLDSFDQRFNQLLQHPEQVRVTMITAFAMIPENELTAWRLVAAGDRRKIVEYFDPTDLQATQGGVTSRNDAYLNQRTPPRNALRDMIKETLREELTRSIEDRVRAVIADPTPLR